MSSVEYILANVRDNDEAFLSTKAIDVDDYLREGEEIVGQQSWQDNWLFSKIKSMSVSNLARRARSNSAVINSEPVSMLVPNPSGDENVLKATIGERDIDEVNSFLIYRHKKIAGFFQSKFW